MPRKAVKVPSYCRHRASGKAVVRINGRDHYLGAYFSSESYEEYEQHVAEWRAWREEAKDVASDIALGNIAYSLTVNELILRYMQFASTYYAQEGEPTKEYVNMKLSSAAAPQAVWADACA